MPSTTATNLISAAPLDFTVYAGDSFKVTLTFTDTNNQPIDLSTATLKMQVKRNLGIPNPALTLTSSDGITISGGSHNILSINKVINLKGAVYFYDLQSTATDGTIITYLRGKFTVVQDVTDSNVEV